MRFNFSKKIFGFSMIEALLAGSLLAMIIFMLSSVLIFGQESSRIAGDRQRASALAEEGLEAVRNMSEASFASLSTGSHGLAISGGKWQFSGTQDNPEIFTRVITITDVDANTKMATSTVTWSATPGRAGSISVATHFTNWRRVASGIGNWASTTIESYASSTLNTSGGDSVRIDGNYAYVGLRGTAVKNFLVFDITTPTVPVLVGSTSVTGAINDMEISGNYVYIASSAGAAEMQIIDVTTKTNPRRPTGGTTGIYNAAGNNAGLSVDVVGTTVYLGKNYSATAGYPEIVIINASNPASPVISGVAGDLSGAVYDIQVSSDYYAYLATNVPTAELEVIDVLFPSSMYLAGWLDIVGTTTSLAAYGVAIFDSNSDNIEDKVVMARAGEGKVWPIDCPTPASCSFILANGFQIPSVGTSNINDIRLFNANKYLALATAAATAEVVVVDITTLSAPAVLSSTNIVGPGNVAVSFLARGIDYSVLKDRLLAVGSRVAANNYMILEIIKPN